MKQYLLLAAAAANTFWCVAQSPTVIDINPGISNSLPNNLGVVNNVLFIGTAINSNGGLWKTDGTTAGTQIVKNNVFVDPPYYYPKSSAVMGNKVFFAATDYSQGNIQPWVSDGTAAGTFELKKINDDTDSQADEFTTLNNKVLFTALEYQTTGGDMRSLWSTDGTTAGTIKLMEFPVLSNGGTGVRPQSLTLFNNKIYFIASVETTRNEIWETDGTVQGTRKLLNNPEDAYSYEGATFKVMNNQLYLFNTNMNESPTTYSLWHINVNTPTATLVKNNEAYSGNVVGNKLFFVGSDANNTGLWVSDGSAAGTMFVKDFANTEIYSRNIQGLNNKLLFFSNDGAVHSLWSSDGTTTGTVILKAFSAFEIVKDESVIYNGKMYFSTYNTTTQVETIWASDGTAAGTAQLITETQKIFRARTYQIMNGSLYFQAALDATSGFELWKLTSTPTGIDKLENASTLFAYPNPAQNTLHINLPYNTTEINMFTLDGQKVAIEKPINNTIDVSQLNNGIYIAEVKTANSVEHIKWIKSNQ